MTLHPTEPWVPYADLLEMPLKKRVKYVRTNLGMTQGAFAEAVGASSGRQGVIRWEKGGSEPRDFASSIAGLTPYPAEAFLRSEAEGVSLATIDLRLRAIEARLALMPTTEDVLAAFETLRGSIDSGASRRTRATKAVTP